MVKEGEDRRKVGGRRGEKGEREREERIGKEGKKRWMREEGQERKR